MTILTKSFKKRLNKVRPSVVILLICVSLVAGSAYASLVSDQTTELVYPRDIPGNKLYTLKSYLVEQESPLQDYVEILLLQPNWKFVLAISQAESGMCVYHIEHNCWGIGGGNIRKYPSFAEAIVDANAVVQRYADRGYSSTLAMMPYYVGWENQGWVLATQDVFWELKQLGL